MGADAQAFLLEGRARGAESVNDESPDSKAVRKLVEAERASLEGERARATSGIVPGPTRVVLEDVARKLVKTEVTPQDVTELPH